MRRAFRPALAASALLASACASVPPLLTTLPACPGVSGRSPRATEYDDPTMKAFGAELAALTEPVMSCPRAADVEVYRLLLSRSWQPPWVVRIERVPAGAYLQAARLDREAGGPDARVAERRARRLDQGAWERLAAALRAADFWSLPSPEPKQGLDGQTWVVEGLRGHAYHAVRRWSPRGDDPYRALGVVFLELAGLGDLAVVPEPRPVELVGPDDLPR